MSGLSLNTAVPLRRPWKPAGEWQGVVSQDEYHRAFFYHGSQGSLAAVRWENWKLQLNPNPQLFDLEKDPGETKPVRNSKVIKKLRAMAILFHEEMRTSTRPAGELPLPK
jgi:arylsulfatase A-like enzyme